jgi:hypothetical protein
VALVLVNVVIAVLAGEFAKSSMERMQEKMLSEVPTDEFMLSEVPSDECTFSPLTR